MSYYQKKEWPKWDDFIRENKPSIAIINCQQHVQPARNILGLVNMLKLEYIVEIINLQQHKTPADIETIIHSRDCFIIGKKNIKPKIVVFENVEQIKPKSAVMTYLQEKVIEIYGKNMFIILVVDKDAVEWNYWIGYLDKLPVPKFRMFSPNKEEKQNALQELVPFTLVYKPNSELSIKEKMQDVSTKITTAQEIRTFQDNVIAFGQLYKPDREQRDECNLFDAISFLRNKCRISCLKDWKKIENVLKQHSTSGSGGLSITDKDIVRKLVNFNPPEINTGMNMITFALKSKWYNEFAELDSLGFEGSKLAPVTIGLTSWSEKFKVPKFSLSADLMEEDNKAVGFSKKKLKSDFDNFASSQNFMSCNEYFSNQFTPFEIFDSISLMRNVDFMFDYHNKVMSDSKDVNVLIKRLRTQFGIILEVGPRIPRLHRPELIEEQKEMKRKEQEKEDEEEAKKIQENKLAKKRRGKKNKKDEEDEEEIRETKTIKKRKPRKKKYQMSDDDDDDDDDDKENKHET